MRADDLDRTAPPRLSEMLSLDPATGAVWHADELAAVWRHQLAAQIDHDLGEAGGEVSGVSFADLLHQPQPSVQLLDRAKRFAKACKNDPYASLPKEVASALYFACILVARLRCGARISELDDDSLLRGLQWIIAQPWVDAATRTLASDGLAQLAGSKG